MFKEIRELLGFGRIYLDFASGTPVDIEVEKVITNIEKDFFANPSAIHHEGRTAHLMVEEARKSVARSLKVHGDEIIFTSGATESNNLCIGGVLGGEAEAEVITTKVEHSAILAPLKKFSSKISFISLNESGYIDIESFKKLLNPNIKLVSVSLINSETGIVAPTREMFTIIKRYKESLNRGELDYPFFHIDGSQAPLVVSVERDDIKADLLTLDSGKIYGPKGVGVLSVKRGIVLKPIILGGGQEGGRRAGTENLPGYFGFSKALEKCVEDRQKFVEKCKELRGVFIKELIKNKIRYESYFEDGAEHILNICFPEMRSDSEYAVMRLSELGVSSSSTSACVSLSGSNTSKVLSEIEKTKNCASKSIRFSFGRTTTNLQIKKAVQALKRVTITN